MVQLTIEGGMTTLTCCVVGKEIRQQSYRETGLPYYDCMYTVQIDGNSEHEAEEEEGGAQISRYSGDVIPQP